MKKRNYLLALAIAAALSITCIVGCGTPQKAAKTSSVITEDTASVTIEEAANAHTAAGGILCLKVNPEIAVHYDDKGLVTKIEARNNDAKAIIEKYTGYEGKETHTVVKDLVAAIGDAGYFVEEVEGIGKRITIEIEVGSVLPNDTFVDRVVSEVKDYVSSNNYRNYIELEGNTNYGITDYGFVPNTNTAPAPKAEPAPTPASTPKAEPAPTPAPASRAVTDYHITDYGKTNYDDHTTDYGRTNYDDHVTDYGRTNYDNDFRYDD